MSTREKTKRDPVERVENMNRIFDKLILPMIAFTLVMFVVFGLIPKLGTCGGEKADDDIQEAAKQDDIYTLRTVLLEDFSGNQTLFEDAGFVFMENDGRTIAYCSLDSGVEVIENLSDSHGYTYTMIYRTDEESGRDVTIMLYSRSIILVLAEDGEESASALFDSDEFAAGVSDTDAERLAVLSIAGADELSLMVEQYKSALRSVVE